MCVSFCSSGARSGKFLSKLADRGLKDHPDSPLYYLLVVANQMMQPGIRAFNPVTVKQKLERALESARKSSDPRDVKLVPLIKEALERMPAFQRTPSRSRPGGRHSFPIPDSLDPADLPPELKRHVDEYCAANGLTPDEFLEYLFHAAMDADSEPPPPTKRRGRRR